MMRIAIVVEGDTEEAFVKTILSDVFLARNKHLLPINLNGSVNLDRMARFIRNASHSFDYITTLFDFYGVKDNVYVSDGGLITALQDAIRRLPGAAVNNLIPYVQMYEFEALLFSKPDCFNHLSIASASDCDALQAIAEQFASPEAINNSPLTAPSKRIASIIKHYDKVEHGILVARTIGIDVMRAACPKFNAWLTQLEAL